MNIDTIGVDGSKLVHTSTKYGLYFSHTGDIWLTVPGHTYIDKSEAVRVLLEKQSGNMSLCFQILKIQETASIEVVYRTKPDASGHSFSTVGDTDHD